MGKLFVASTFAAWAGAMWWAWREARLTPPPPPPSQAAPARPADLAAAPAPPIAPPAPSPSVERQERELRPRTPPPAAEPAAVGEPYDQSTTAEIRGDVVDPDGRPLTTAVLTARCSGRVYERDLDASSFRLTVAPGWCTVFAADHLGHSQSRDFSVAAGDSVSITLAPRGLDERPRE